MIRLAITPIETRTSLLVCMASAIRKSLLSSLPFRVSYIPTNMLTPIVMNITTKLISVTSVIWASKSDKYTRLIIRKQVAKIMTAMIIVNRVSNFLCP